MPDELTTPAARIIARFGVKRLSAWTGRHASRVHAWTWPRARGGTGGAVPLPCRPGIIAGALAELSEVVAYTEFEPVPGEAYLDIAVEPGSVSAERERRSSELTS